MKTVCPFCDWPEFAPEHKIEQVRGGLLGLLVRWRMTGKIVRCARCTQQFAIGESGAYKITPARAHAAAPASPAATPPATLSLVDDDQAEAWK